jgi:hypothetical protein
MDARVAWAERASEEELRAFTNRHEVEWRKGHLKFAIHKPAGVPLGVFFKDCDGRWVVFQLDPEGYAFQHGSGLLVGDEIVDMNGNAFRKEQAQKLISSKDEALDLSFTVSRIVPVDVPVTAPVAAGAPSALQSQGAEANQLLLARFKETLKSEIRAGLKKDLRAELLPKVLADVKREKKYIDAVCGRSMYNCAPAICSFDDMLNPQAKVSFASEQAGR